jgi:anti-sigma factor RsiW
MEVRCGDSAALAGYLYDEIDAVERQAVERHLAHCASCTEDLAALRNTRVQLTAWAPPEARLGFRIVADEAPETRPMAEPAVATRRWWQWPMVPAWAQATAAVALFACGLVVAAVMNMEVRYDQAGLTIRTGWPSSAAAATNGQASPVSAGDLAALEARMRDEFAHVRASAEGNVKPVDVSAPEPPARASNADLLQRMRDIVAESESRQKGELALRLSQVMHDMDLSRRADLARIERTVSPMEGVTTEEMLQQRQMLNYLMRVSQQK